MQEELLQSPFRTIVRNFLDNKLALGAVIVFLTIFLIVLIGPIFAPTDLNESEETQTNIAPGRNMMDVPKELAGNVKEIATGLRSVLVWIMMARFTYGVKPRSVKK